MIASSAAIKTNEENWPYISEADLESPMSQKSNSSSTNNKIGVLSLAVLTFYLVSGGAFGIEDVVRAGGPFYALLGFSLLFVWAIPEILISCELSTALPEASGSVAWVSAAFGDFWGFQKGWLSWLSGVADNALYPILFLDTLVALIEDDSVGEYLSTGFGRWTFIGTATIFLTYLNYRGLEVVGNTTIILSVFTMCPFVVFCCIGAFQVDPSRWLQRPPGGLDGIQWGMFLNTFFWNINYWESAASFSGDVTNPSVTFPRGMGLALALVFLFTFVPVLIGTGASSLPYSEWSDGYFAKLAADVAGPWLGIWMVLGGAVSNIGMFEAEMSTDSWQVQ